jgi:hypothetical protein
VNMEVIKIVINQEWVKIYLAILILAVGILLMGAGCRSREFRTMKYFESGKVQEQSYSIESGFHFFSDGQGKTLSPSLNVSGF